MTESPSLQDRRSPLISRRHVLIGGALAAASAVAIARQPTSVVPAVPEKAFEKLVPKQFGSWRVVGSSGVVLPPPDALSDRLYDNLVTRVYESPEASVMLLLAYNNLQDGVVQVHRPEVCYPVGGFELSSTVNVPLVLPGAQIPASFFTAEGPDRVEQVLYFTRLGTAYPRSWGEQRWAVAKANLDGRIPDGVMMRVSLLGRDPAAALETLSQFSTEFIAASPQALQKLLLV
ncbi:EpsI family protein [Altererythrobacter sp. SALINAS58]|uniref:exosortase-associated protein EpsI, V-type n=1 Tax=Alteripontixanthobacter muriae TaxID=2705546 RepID=UPI0015757CFE|nr:exosortase-associated protein EpsI, V-type [Alteripontixanthobacter muriae]NTZ43945.1 EpsI family protein [Alteripontixanthobacter muriae]